MLLCALELQTSCTQHTTAVGTRRMVIGIVVSCLTRKLVCDECVVCRPTMTPSRVSGGVGGCTCWQRKTAITDYRLVAALLLTCLQTSSGEYTLGTL